MNALAPHLALLYPEAALFFAAVALLVADSLGARGERSGRAAGLAAAGVLVSCWGAWSAPPTSQFDIVTFGGAFVVDDLTRAARLILLPFAALTVVLWRPATSRHAIASDGGVLSLLLLSTAGTLLLAGARDLLLLVLAVELATLPLLPLIALRPDDPRGPEGAMKYFLLSAAATAVMLLGVAYIAAGAGGTRYELLQAAGGLAGAGGSGTLRAGLLLLLAGLAFKVGAVPFHAWVPDAYVAAPTILAGHMAVVVKIGAFAALARIALTRTGDPAFLSALLALAALSVTAGNLAAFAQRNLKRLLAWSSVAHTGFLLIPLAAAVRVDQGRTLAPHALAAFLVYLGAYAIVSYAAFLLVAYVERSDRPDEDLSLLDGLAGRGRGLGFALFVAMAGLAGLPPVVGFWGKVGAIRQAFFAGIAPLAVVATLTQIVAIAYYLRPLERLFRSDAASAAPEGSRWLLAFSCGLGAAALFLGLWPAPMMWWIEG